MISDSIELYEKSLDKGATIEEKGIEGFNRKVSYKKILKHTRNTIEKEKYEKRKRKYSRFRGAAVFFVFSQ